MSLIENRKRRRIRQIALILTGLAVVSSAFASKKKENQEPTATLSFVILKDDNGKPVRNAGVILHLVTKNDKQERGGLELKTDPDGKCSLEGIPYGKVRVQVLASGFQTYGEDYDVSEPTMGITIKLQRPKGLYSIYDDHPASDSKPDDTTKSSTPQAK
jgi:5-hydroxyisourate hydrolase-like protein (transthyretin family)